MQNNLQHQDRDPNSYNPVQPSWVYPPAPYMTQEDSINLLEYWRILMKRKWMIFLATLLFSALGFALTLRMSRTYRAEVTLMPITSGGNAGGGMANVASQLSSLPMVGGALGDLGKLGGGKTKELINILKSRTLATQIIQKFDLMKVLFAKQYNPQTQTFHEGFPAFLKPIPVLEDAVAKFRNKVTKVEEEKKSGLIKIQVTFKDPAMSAKVANQMVVELQNFIENNSLTLSKRNRIFLEEQLVKTQAKLLEAGKELNQFYSENRISSVIPQLDVDVGSYQTSPKAFSEFQDELTKLNNEQKGVEDKKEFARVTRVPGQVYLQYLTLNRELLAKIYSFLTQQYELAKIEESKEDLAFQVIDKAEVKVRATSPNLILNVAFAFLFGMFSSVFLAFFIEYIQRLKKLESSR